MPTTADIKNGVTIKFNNQLCTIVEFQHVKPGKGGAFVRTKMRSVSTGRILDNTFRSGEKIEIIRLESRDMQYLYQEGESFVFMDQENFEQVQVPTEVVGDSKNFLKEGEVAEIQFHAETPLNITLPFFLEFEIVECEPGVKGDTVSNVTKPATLETGAIVQVPLFVEQGEWIRVDTRTSAYMERVKK